MIGIQAAVAIALSTSAPAAAAAPAEEMTCVGVGRIWRGVPEDIRRIGQVPVPAQYREFFFEGGCGSGLIHETLIDWHLAFGNEASVTAALAFLDHAYLDHAPPLADWPATFTRLSRVARAERRGGAGPGAAARGLSDFSRTFAHLIFLSDQYLRAAEYFASASLEEKARRQFDTVQAVLSIARAQNPALTSASQSSDHELEYEEHEIADLEMRLAILKARLSRNPADIDAAAAIVDRNYAPVLRLAAENAERQDDFCDSGHGDQLDPIRAACEAQSYFIDRLVRFWRNQAQLDMLMAADPAHYVEVHGRYSASSGSAFARRAAPAGPGEWPMVQSLYNARRLLEYQRLEREFGGTVFRYRWDSRTSEDIFSLYLGEADMYRRLADDEVRSGQRPDQIASYLGGALSALEQAERLAPPSEIPARFRRIALLYPEVAGEEERYRRRASEGRWGADAAHARKAVYFRLMLNNLDQIATAGPAVP